MANGQVGTQGTAESCLGTRTAPLLTPAWSLRKGTTTLAAGDCSVHRYTPCLPSLLPSSLAGVHGWKLLSSLLYLSGHFSSACGLLPDEG